MVRVRNAGDVVARTELPGKVAAIENARLLLAAFYFYFMLGLGFAAALRTMSPAFDH